MFFALGLPVMGLGAVAAITKYHLSGPDLSEYDAPDYPVTFTPDPTSDGAKAVAEYLQENFIKPAQAKGSNRQKLDAKRKRFDDIGLTRAFEGCTFQNCLLYTSPSPRDS